MIWIEFVICAVLLVGAATLLSRYGDVLAEKTGLGRVWVGALLIAGVTSLPELASGITAVTVLNAPNLAAGGVLGSCLFNIALIAFIDLAYQPGSILAKAQEGHILSGGWGILLLGLAAGAALLKPEINSDRPVSPLRRRPFSGRQHVAARSRLQPRRRPDWRDRPRHQQRAGQQPVQHDAAGRVRSGRWTRQFLGHAQPVERFHLGRHDDDDRRGDRQSDLPRLAAHAVSYQLGRRRADRHVPRRDGHAVHSGLERITVWFTPESRL